MGKLRGFVTIGNKKQTCTTCFLCTRPYLLKETFFLHLLNDSTEEKGTVYSRSDHASPQRALWRTLSCQGTWKETCDEILNDVTLVQEIQDVLSGLNGEEKCTLEGFQIRCAEPLNLVVDSIFLTVHQWVCLLVCVCERTGVCACGVCSYCYHFCGVTLCAGVEQTHPLISCVRNTKSIY